MSLRLFAILLGLLVGFVISANAQLAFNPLMDESTPVVKLVIESSEKAMADAMGARVVSIPVRLHVQSDVKIEIRDALGGKLFQSEATYPEGEQEIRVGMGSMEQGLYFVRVTTVLDEISRIVLVERPE